MSRYKTKNYSNKHTQGAVFPTDRPKRAKLPSN